MNIQTEIKNIIEKAVHQAIDELAIKQTIREHVASAISKEEIVSKTDNLIDSYFRSAMNSQSVEMYIQKRIESLVSDAVKKEIEKVIGRYGSWSGNERIKEHFERELRAELSRSYDLSVSIKPKE